MEKQVPVQLRKGTQADVGFVFNSWLKCYRDAPASKNIINSIYYHEHHKVVEKLVLDSRNITIIACNPEDPDQIYGYCCAGYYDNIFAIHFIYVKQPFRKLGIAKTLFNAYEHDINTLGVYTHHNHISQRLHKRYNLLYHPYILINYQEDSDARLSEETERAQPGGAKSRARMGTDNEEETKGIQQESADKSSD